MAKFGMVSGVVGVLVAAGTFVALQKWTPPDSVLDLIGANTGREPPPQDPRHRLEVRIQGQPGAAAIVTQADIVAARVRPAPSDGDAGVSLELRGGGRTRLAAHARDHAGDVLIVDVDGTVVSTQPASAFAGATALDVSARPPLEREASDLAAHFGGAPIPVEPYLLQAARLVPALVAGLIALAIVRILTRR